MQCEYIDECERAFLNGSMVLLLSLECIDWVAGEKKGVVILDEEKILLGGAIEIAPKGNYIKLQQKHI